MLSNPLCPHASLLPFVTSKNFVSYAFAAQSMLASLESVQFVSVLVLRASRTQCADSSSDTSIARR